jgi:hypothetical protein
LGRYGIVNFFHESIQCIQRGDIRLRKWPRNTEAVMSQAQQRYTEYNWSKGDLDNEVSYRNSTGNSFPILLRRGREALQRDWLKDIAREEGRSANADRRRATARVRSAGSCPFAGGDGNLTLDHWSAEPRALLDPTSAGTGPLNGGECRVGLRHFLSAPELSNMQACRVLRGASASDLRHLGCRIEQFDRSARVGKEAGQVENRMP